MPFNATARRPASGIRWHLASIIQWPPSVTKARPSLPLRSTSSAGQPSACSVRPIASACRAKDERHHLDGAATLSTSSNRRDLPIPASPSMTTTRPRPFDASATTALNPSNTRRRPTNPVPCSGPPTPMHPHRGHTTQAATSSSLRRCTKRCMTTTHSLRHQTVSSTPARGEHRVGAEPRTTTVAHITNVTKPRHHAIHHQEHEYEVVRSSDGPSRACDGLSLPARRGRPRTVARCHPPGAPVPSASAPISDGTSYMVAPAVPRADPGNPVQHRAKLRRCAPTGGGCRPLGCACTDRQLDQAHEAASLGLPALSEPAFAGDLERGALEQQHHAQNDSDPPRRRRPIAGIVFGSLVSQSDSRADNEHRTTVLEAPVVAAGAN